MLGFVTSRVFNVCLSVDLYNAEDKISYNKFKSSNVSLLQSYIATAIMVGLECYLGMRTMFVVIQ